MSARFSARVVAATAQTSVIAVAAAVRAARSRSVRKRRSPSTRSVVSVQVTRMPPMRLVSSRMGL